MNAAMREMNGLLADLHIRLAGERLSNREAAQALLETIAQLRALQAQI